MPISFHLGCIYSDRVEVWLPHAPVDKIGNLIWIVYIFCCSLLNFYKNIFNFSIRFQNNKLFKKFIYIINNLLRLWSKIRGSCHNNNKRKKPQQRTSERDFRSSFLQMSRVKKKKEPMSCYHRYWLQLKRPWKAKISYSQYKKSIYLLIKYLKTSYGMLVFYCNAFSLFISWNIVFNKYFCYFTKSGV